MNIICVCLKVCLFIRAGESEMDESLIYLKHGASCPCSSIYFAYQSLLRSRRVLRRWAAFILSFNFLSLGLLRLSFFFVSTSLLGPDASAINFEIVPRSLVVVQTICAFAT